ncbi:hypothetical protein GCM10011412_09760 [Maribacter cobaltidurans]|nr:hypothetical protein GCM10011412_09760 [Maribacter cobaltidurans]
MYAHVLTTERMAAFIPGESPPEVSTAIFFMFEDIRKIKPTKLVNLLSITKYACHPFDEELKKKRKPVTF